MDDKSRVDLAKALLPVIKAAGAAILKVRDAGFDARLKADGSPVTEADLASESVISAGISVLGTGIPTVSEECANVVSQPNFSDPTYFLVDPLDGTREFLAGRSEFTVNIALVEESVPTLGIILAPATGKLFFATGTGAAFEQLPDGCRRQLACASRTENDELLVLASRSHLDAETQSLVNRLGRCTVRQCGSSLKFALLADGQADLYPRLAPTMAGDTAAGQALLEAAGGVVVRPNGARLSCSPATALRNTGFIAARGEIAVRAIQVLRSTNVDLHQPLE